VRQKELEEACRILGLQHLEFLPYRDSGMDGTAENEDPRALVQADTAEVTAKIVALIRRFQPDVVITFEPFGWYGHPDHIFVGKWTTAAFPLTADPGYHPEAGPIWQPDKLFHSVLPFSKFRAMTEQGIEAGYIEEDGFGNDFPDQVKEMLLKTEAAVTHILDMTAHHDTRTAALASHLTQFGEDNLFNKIPKEIVIQATGYEHYIQVFPTPPPDLTQNPATALFDK
jgi:LmbE family N-acetylglucosaminyl deacetylase